MTAKYVVALLLAGAFLAVALGGCIGENKKTGTDDSLEGYIRDMPESATGVGGFHGRGQIPSGWDGANIILGNGAFSIQMRDDSGLCTVSWPYPSNYDQIDYIGLNMINGTIEDSTIYSGQPYRPNMGSYVGVRADGKISWITDGSWICTQRYLSNSTAVSLTRAENRAIGIIIEAYDFVLMDSDVLVRDFKVTNTGPARQIEVVYYENLNPTMKENKFGLQSGIPDEENYDYAVEYDSSSDSLMHYNPGDDTSESVYFAISSSEKSTRHYCGVEESSTDALDVENAGGAGQADSAEGKVNAVLAFDLGNVEDGAVSEVPIYFAVGPTKEKAQALLSAAKSIPASGHLENTNLWWEEWSGHADLSSIPDPIIRAVVKRALITIKIHQSTETGGIVASTCRQTGYNYCWPRDTWPMVLSFDRLGYTEEVRRFIEFFKLCQQDDGHWSENAWCNGSATSQTNSAVEATAILVCAPYEHYKFTGDLNWLESIWPMMKKAADWVKNQKDPMTKMQSPSYEGDVPTPCESILGAACAYRAMRTASEVAALLGHGDDPSVPLWDARADEIQNSLDPVFWIESEGKYAEVVQIPLFTAVDLPNPELVAITENILEDPSKGIEDLAEYLASQPDGIAGMFDSNGTGFTFFRDTSYGTYNGPIVTWVSEPTKLLPYNDPRVVATGDAAWDFYEDMLLNPQKFWDSITITAYSGEMWTYPLAWTNYYFAVAS
ncbi:MAG: glycoside hydrolase family 15 protein, partial [Candidatus Thermoplasmatota archaeon]|nr:glycoside hydrolase family 15 protein [Candidatus Thermoplasmatota archaeon]